MPRLLPTAVLLLAGLVGAETGDRLHEQIDLLGRDFIVHEIPAPVLERPAEWINRRDGDYHYLYTAGDDHGRKEQVETHHDLPAQPGVWQRMIGESLVEWFEVQNGAGIRFFGETDRHHGFEVRLAPGVTIPPGIAPGAVWGSESAITAARLDSPGRTAYEGRLQTTNRYVGAYRVKVPAGEFEAVLIEQQLSFVIGALQADDVRHLFYARGAGVVAEVEGLRASALIVIRVKEKSAKVLTKIAAH